MGTRDVALVLFVGTALVLSAVIFVFQAEQRASAADAGNMMMEGAMTKGQIASIQHGSSGQPEWIQSGIWVIRMLSPSSGSDHPTAWLIARFAMVKPDGTAMHSHNIYNFKASEMTQEGNSTKVLNGTATVTMKDGPVSDVPITVKVFNNAVIGFWIGPDKVDGHFGTGPVYGILSTNSRAMMQEMHSMMQGMNGSMSNTGQNNTIKMSAKEVDEVYRWSTDAGINPILKLLANTNNMIQIQNPTDQKHELVIESNGTELASSGDIGPNSSGQLTFKPTMDGTFAYHCEYHPETMKGIIEVTNPS